MNFVHARQSRGKLDVRIYYTLESLMGLKPISGKQFVRWFIVFTIGLVLVGSLGADASSIGWGIVGVSGFMLATPQERSRPLRPNELYWIFIGLILFVALALFSTYWLPRDWGDPYVEFMRSSAFVASFWVLGTWLSYRRYKMGKKNDVEAT